MSETRSQYHETYLGDGLYASFDGWQIWLRATREGIDHKVALDTETYASLVAYAQKLRTA